MKHLIREGLDIMFNTFKADPAKIIKDTPIYMLDFSISSEGAAMLTLYANSRLPFGTVILQKQAMTSIATHWLAELGYTVTEPGK